MFGTSVRDATRPILRCQCRPARLEGALTSRRQALAPSPAAPRARSGAASVADVRYGVRSVGRALDAIERIAEAGEHGLSLAEVARALQVSKSSALALLRTLAAHGYLRADHGLPRYQLGVALIRLGDLSAGQLPLAAVCNQALRRIAEDTGLTARAAIAEDGHPVFVGRVDGSGTVRFHTPLGRRERAHSTAAGKAILASMEPDRVRRLVAETGLARVTRHTITELDGLLEDLQRVRRRGFAIDDEEDADGVFCVGAGFFDHSGRCTGALSVTGIKVEASSSHMRLLGGRLRREADGVSVLLGGRPYARSGR